MPQVPGPNTHDDIQKLLNLPFGTSFSILLRDHKKLQGNEWITLIRLPNQFLDQTGGQRNLSEVFTSTAGGFMLPNGLPRTKLERQRDSLNTAITILSRTLSDNALTVRGRDDLVKVPRQELQLVLSEVLEQLNALTLQVGAERGVQ
jgi:hypothetical protein